METHFLGFVIQPHSLYPNSTSLMILMQVDTKGWLPAFFANRYVAKALTLWQNLLSDYYWDEYTKTQCGSEEQEQAGAGTEERSDELESGEDCEGINTSLQRRGRFRVGWGVGDSPGVLQAPLLGSC